MEGDNFIDRHAQEDHREKHPGKPIAGSVMTGERRQDRQHPGRRQHHEGFIPGRQAVFRIQCEVPQVLQCRPGADHGDEDLARKRKPEEKSRREPEQRDNLAEVERQYVRSGRPYAFRGDTLA
jgi:hypothetical protein